MFLLTIYLPWLLNMLPYSYWALTCLAVLPTYSAFMISVRQASDLPPASFRFPVTQDTLALGYILPAVGRIGDFHPLKHAPAGRTKKGAGQQLSCYPAPERFCEKWCPQFTQNREHRHTSPFIRDMYFPTLALSKSGSRSRLIKPTLSPSI